MDIKDALIRWDRRWTDDKLNVIYNLVDEPEREGEEERYYLAISLIFLHPDLDAAIAYESSGGRVGSYAAQRTLLPDILTDLARIRRAVQQEMSGDADTRISSENFLRVKNAIFAALLEISAYQGAVRARLDRSFGEASYRHEQQQVRTEYNLAGSLLSGLMAKAGLI